MTYNIRDTSTLFILHSHFQRTKIIIFNYKGVHIFEPKMQEIDFARNIVSVKCRNISGVCCLYV